MNTLRIFNPVFTNSLFDALGTTLYGADTSYTRNISPAADVRQTANTYLLDMDLPGYTEHDIHIQVKERVLRIASKHHEEAVQETKPAAENTESAEQFLLQERVRGEFVRRFTLPEDSDTENIEAAFKNGVLTVTVPRKAALPHRDIMIKAS